MKQSYIFLLLIIFQFIVISSYAQTVYPLSRNDSAMIVQYEKSYDEQIEKNSLKGASDFKNKSAMLYWELNHFDEAERFFLESLAINKKLANRNAIAMINNNLAMIYADKKDYQKSLDYFAETLLARRVGNEKTGIISALINQSVVYNKLEQYEPAIANLEEALDLAREMNDPKQMRSCYGMLSETYQKAGNTEKSLYYYDYFKTFNELVTDTRIKKSTKELEIERLRAELAESNAKQKDLELFKKDHQLTQKNEELEESNSEIKYLVDSLTKKELAIEVIKKEAKIKQLEAHEIIKKKQNTIKIILSFSIFVIIISLLLLLAYRQKRHINIKLKQQNEAILQQKEEILIQKEEIVEQDKILKVTNVKLKELNIMKDGLTGMLIHDLKNPLGSIINLSKKKEIVNAGNQMLRIVNNILDVQKYEDTKMTLDIKNYSLLKIANHALLQVRYLARYKNIKIENKIDNNIRIKADEEITERIFVNLLTNAIKYTPENKLIIIDAQKNNTNFIQIQVTDNGFGIIEDKISIIFDKFAQTNARKSGTIRSSGLGLTFCKMAVEAHGGKIKVESKPNVKTTFSFTIPKGIDFYHNKKNTNKTEQIEATEDIIILDKEETKYLNTFIDKFQKFEVYEISETRAINASIDGEFSKAIKIWKNKMDMAIYSCNEEIYNKMIK